MMNWDKASLLIHIFWGICDPEHTNLDPDNAYELCLLYLVADFMCRDLVATPETRLEFLKDTATVIKDFKEGGMFVNHPFSVKVRIIGEWCHEHRAFYELE
jgi:hypothetical protein